MDQWPCVCQSLVVTSSVCVTLDTDPTTKPSFGWPESEGPLVKGLTMGCGAFFFFLLSALPQTIIHVRYESVATWRYFYCVRIGEVCVLDTVFSSAAEDFQHSRKGNSFSFWTYLILKATMDWKLAVMVWSAPPFKIHHDRAVGEGHVQMEHSWLYNNHFLDDPRLMRSLQIGSQMWDWERRHGSHQFKWEHISAQSAAAAVEVFNRHNEWVILIVLWNNSLWVLFNTWGSWRQTVWFWDPAHTAVQLSQPAGSSEGQFTRHAFGIGVLRNGWESMPKTPLLKFISGTKLLFLSSLLHYTAYIDRQREMVGRGGERYS